VGDDGGGAALRYIVRCDSAGAEPPRLRLCSGEDLEVLQEAPAGALAVGDGVQLVGEDGQLRVGAVARVQGGGLPLGAGCLVRWAGQGGVQWCAAGVQLARVPVQGGAGGAAGEAAGENGGGDTASE